MSTPEEKAKELDASYEASQQAAAARPQGRPAPLPPHPATGSDKHPDDPDAA